MSRRLSAGVTSPPPAPFQLGHDLGLRGEPGAEAGADGVAQLEHPGIGDEVIAVVPNLPPPDDSRLLKDAQMLADVGLRRTDGSHQLADVLLAGLHLLEEV